MRHWHRLTDIMTMSFQCDSLSNNPSVLRVATSLPAIYLHVHTHTHTHTHTVNVCSACFPSSRSTLVKCHINSKHGLIALIIDTRSVSHFCRCCHRIYAARCYTYTEHSACFYTYHETMLLQQPTYFEANS